MPMTSKQDNKRRVLLEKIDNEISSALTDIDSLIDDYRRKLENKNNCIEFSLSDSKESIRRKINKIPQKTCGVYFFQIKCAKDISQDTWSKEFIDKWDKPNLVHHFIATTKKKRISKHEADKVTDLIPLYIGKCKNINKRVNEHLFLDESNSTYSMKLLLHKKEFAHSVIRITYCKIEVKNYEVVMSRVERQLREKLQPIVGKQ